MKRLLIIALLPLALLAGCIYFDDTGGNNDTGVLMQKAYIINYELRDGTSKEQFFEDMGALIERDIASVNDYIRFNVRYNGNDCASIFMKKSDVLDFVNGGINADQFHSALTVSWASYCTPAEADNYNPSFDGKQSTTNDATQAYKEYIAAYNKLTDLMSKGLGDTPEGQQAYADYKSAKDKYEAIAQQLKNS